MVDESQASQSRAPGAPAGATTAMLVAAAVAGVASFTGGHEGTVYHAYLDGGHVPTICDGHTLNVHMGDVATPAECRAYYVADMTPKMEFVLRVTPAVKTRMTVLQASGDLAFNSGPGRYQTGPMAALFAKGSWVAGCNSFIGYMTLYKAPAGYKPRSKDTCRFNAKHVLYCEAGGLVTRRKDEAKLCLSGLSA